MTEYKTNGVGEPYLVDWNGRAIIVGNTVLHASAKGLLTLSRVTKIYQKPSVRRYYDYSDGVRGYREQTVMDTLVRLEPIESPLNVGFARYPRTINSRINYVTYNSLTRFEVHGV